MKRIHELDNKVKAQLFKEQTLDESTKHSKDITQAAKDKIREGQRQIQSLEFNRDNNKSTLESTAEIAQSYREELQKKDFEIIRENYGYRVQIEGLKRIVAERAEIIESMTVDKRMADAEVSRVSEVIEAVREEAVKIAKELRDRIKMMNFQARDLDDIVYKTAGSIAEKEDALEAGLVRESLQKKQLETAKDTLFALAGSVNEGHANVSLMNNRVKDTVQLHIALMQEVADLDAASTLLKEKLENVQYVNDEANAGLAAASAHVKKLMIELEAEMDMDKAHGDHLTQAKIFAKQTEKKLQEMSIAEAAAYAKVNVVMTQVEILRKDTMIVETEIRKQNQMIEEKMMEGERLVNSLQQKTQEANYAKNNFMETKAELDATLAAKDATIDRMRRALLLTDAKNESIRSMMLQSDQMLREDREKLEKNIISVQALDAGLTGQLHEAEEKTYEIGLSLENETERDSVLTARIAGVRKEMKPLILEFDGQVVALENKVSKKSRQVYDLEDESSRVRGQARVMQLKYDEESAQENKLRSKVRVQQVRRAAAADELEINQSLESEFESRIGAIEVALTTAEGSLDGKTAECDQYLSKMKEAENVTNFQDRMIRDEQSGQAKMKQALGDERKALQDIDRMIRLKEGQFENDANAVQERLMAYQNMLVERQEGANRISGEIKGEAVAQQIAAHKFEEVTDVMESEKCDFDEKMRAKNQQKDEFRTQISEREVNIMQAEAEIQRSSEAASDNRIKLDGTLNEVEVLKDEVDISRREAKQLELQLETRGAYEKELFDSMTMKDATIRLLETQLQDADGVDSSLHLQIKALSHEQKVLKDKLMMRKQSEDALVNELESAKMRFSSVAPIEDVNLQTSMHRAEAHRAEYANTLLKIIGN